MRELKFRVWKKDQQRWVNHSYKFDNCLNAYNNSGTPISEREEIELISQQYTGMKDRNGKEVYEGDIVKWGMSHDQEIAFPRLRVVEFNEKQLIYKVVEVGDLPALVDYLYEAIQPSTRWCEVVGNIMENPELLKQ
jgi:uncharacterized phage protein (TIGR01671 family)